MAFHMPSSPFGRVARGSFDANDEAQIHRRLPSGRGSFRESPSPAEIDGFQPCFSTGRDHFAEFPGRGRSGAEVGRRWAERIASGVTPTCAFSDRNTSSRVASSTRYDAFSRRISSQGSPDGNVPGLP